MNKNKIFLFEIIAVVILVAIDFVTKQLAVKYLSNGSFDIIPGVFSFTLLEGGNSGAAFGMLQGGFWIFIVITIAVLALVIFMLIVFFIMRLFFCLQEPWETLETEYSLRLSMVTAMSLISYTLNLLIFLFSMWLTVM